MSSAVQIQRIVIQHYTLDSVNWLDINPPIPCSVISVENLDGTINIQVRSDKTDPTKERVVQSLQSINFGGPQLRREDNFRFQPGVTVFSIKSQSGAPDVVLEFIR